MPYNHYDLKLNPERIFGVQVSLEGGSEEEVSLPVRTRCIAIRLSLRLKRKTSGLFCMSTIAFINALSPALIDAIPLKCSLSRETSSGLGVDGNSVQRGACDAVCINKANTLCVLFSDALTSNVLFELWTSPSGSRGELKFVCIHP